MNRVHLSIRVPEDLVEAIDRAAVEEDRTRTSVVIAWVRAALRRRPGASRRPRESDGGSDAR